MFSVTDTTRHIIHEKGSIPLKAPSSERRHRGLEIDGNPWVHRWACEGRRGRRRLSSPSRTPSTRENRRTGGRSSCSRTDRIPWGDVWSGIARSCVGPPDRVTLSWTLITTAAFRGNRDCFWIIIKNSVANGRVGYARRWVGAIPSSTQKKYSNNS